MQHKPSIASRPSDVVYSASREFAGWEDAAGRLKAALENDELRLYCQPIASLSTGNPYLMAEVLVRLVEEEAAQLPPGDFLPAFEHYGMMPALDRWVVRQALQAVSTGNSSGFRRLSINVASQTLRDPEMPGFFADQLERFSLPPEALCFEIDEHDVLHHLQEAAKFAAALRAQRCSIAIDGFGYRAVSFDPLKTLTPDFVKIDGSITRNILRSERAERKMRAIVRAAQVLNYEPIAEFVEEVEILVGLRRLGVRYGQGFGIARPGPLDGRA